MKYKLTVLLLCTLVLVPSLTMAESGSSVDNSGSIRDRIRVKTEVQTPDGQRVREEFRQDVRGMGSSSPADMRLKYEERAKIEDMRMRGLASSTRAEIKDMRIETREKVGDLRDEAKMRMRNASSSDDRKEIRNNLRKDVFKAHQDRLVGQLNLALENLKQIRTRISARIDKAEASGRTMTDAKALLVIADAKIATAATEIAALGAFVPPVATSSLTSAADDASTEVELEKPRNIAENAIKAVKDARKALIDVTIAVAKNMGIRCNAEGESLRCQSNATTTPATNVPPTATTTATTTP